MREQQEIESNLWEPLPESEKVTEVQSGPSRSFWQQGFRRLLRDRLFLLAAGFLLLLGLLTLIVPRMWNYSYDEQNLNYASIPPVLALYQLEEDTYVYVTKEFNVIRTDGSGHLLEARRHARADRRDGGEHPRQRGRHRVRRCQGELRGEDLRRGGCRHPGMRHGARWPRLPRG